MPCYINEAVLDYGQSSPGQLVPRGQAKPQAYCMQPESFVANWHRQLGDAAKKETFRRCLSA